MTDALTNLTVTIILQYRHVSNHHAAKLKLTRYVSYILIKLENIVSFIFFFFLKWLSAQLHRKEEVSNLNQDSQIIRKQHTKLAVVGGPLAS